MEYPDLQLQCPNCGKDISLFTSPGYGDTLSLQYRCSNCGWRRDTSVFKSSLKAYGEELIANAMFDI